VKNSSAAMILQIFWKSTATAIALGLSSEQVHMVTDGL